MNNLTTTKLLTRIMNRQDLSQTEALYFMETVLNNDIKPEQLAALLCCLKMKGETQSEILGMILAMRQRAVILKNASDAIDVCGTGGDQLGTFNISTAVAFVVAGGGVKVAKHGNRAVSSRSGSADVLEALGVTISLSPSQASAVLQKVGLVFLFAPTYHPAMRHAAAVRKSLGIPTIFNKLGPFCNPARVRHQLIGIPNTQEAKLLASVATQLPYQRVLIASSHDGLDEVSISAPTTIIEVATGRKTTYIIKPSDFGLKTSPIKALQGGSAQKNANIIRSILNGDVGGQRDIVVLNAGCALYAAQKVATIHEGVERAAESIDSGAARIVLKNLIKESRRYA